MWFAAVLLLNAPGCSPNPITSGNVSGAETQASVDVEYTDARSDTASIDGAETPDARDTACGAALGKVALTIPEALDGFEITGVARAMDGYLLTWQRAVPSDASELPADAQGSAWRVVSRFDCEGSMLWLRDFPDDGDALPVDYQLEPAVVPITVLDGDRFHFCNFDRCGIYSLDGTVLWKSSSSATMLDAHDPDGDPISYVGPWQAEPLGIWNGTSVRWNGIDSAAATLPPWPTMWTVDLGTGNLLKRWDQPVPQSSWTGKLAELEPYKQRFVAAAAVPTSTNEAILVFGNMTYVDLATAGTEIPVAIVAHAQADGTWGSIERLDLPHWSAPDQPKMFGRIAAVVPSSENSDLMLLSSHRSANTSLGASQFVHQVWAFTADGKLRGLTTLPGLVDYEIQRGAPLYPLAGRMLPLDDGRLAVLRRKLVVWQSYSSYTEPELVLLDRHGNVHVMAIMPLPWVPSLPEELDKTPDDEAYRRRRIAPSVDAEPDGRLLVAAERSLWRTTPWLQFNPTEAGVCKDLILADCEDSDPCTADLCDPIQGCVHPTHPDGANCGSGKACQSGACKAVP
ncbi:MAG: hypothetical protein H6747_15990 [Deltaproteobacteria bacterium]|nr:hypothetical protein [Deltaproteobacteria bacterium]